MPRLVKKNAYRLSKEIILRSVASTWDSAKEEWELTNVYYADRDAPETCLCSHYPILEVCVLTNWRNGNEVVVGNCCVRRFISPESDKVFAALRRVTENPESGPNQALIDLASRNGCLSEWEEQFMRDTMRKRRLTDRQKAKREEINGVILDCLDIRGGASVEQPF